MTASADLPQSRTPNGYPTPLRPTPGDRSSGTQATAAVMIVGAFFALPLLAYFGFFAFALLDRILNWGQLGWIDGPTGEFLRFIYWPLIRLVERLGIV